MARAWEPRLPGRTRAKQPTVFTRSAVEAVHARYLAGESSTALAAELGGSERGIIKAFHRLGLTVKANGYQPRRNPFPVRAPKPKPESRARRARVERPPAPPKLVAPAPVRHTGKPAPPPLTHRGDCVWAEGECVVCERKRA